jgi:[acyl-carrier-protein] S-malonyltransferase
MSAPTIQATAPALLLWSGRDELDFERRKQSIVDDLVGGSPEEIRAAALDWTTFDRGDGPIRGAVVLGDAECEDVRHTLAKVRPQETRVRPVALMFPGQGSQYQRMAAGLYGWEPTFTAAMDEFFELIGIRPGVPTGDRLRHDWLAADPEVSIHEVSRSQPLLLGVGHALAQAILGWGVRPSALLGHSAGEMVAAVLSEVFTLADAVEVMAHRAAEAPNQPPGGMLGVAAGADALAPFLTGQVTVAAVNSPRQTVLAGPAVELAQVADRLRDAGLMAISVPSTLGFHTPSMDALAELSLEVLDRVRLGTPALPLYSAYTTDLLTDEKARDRRFWARQVAEPVLFWPTLEQVLADGDYLLIEAGPGEGLTTSARRHKSVIKKQTTVVAAVPARPGPADADRRALLGAAAALWTEGYDLDLDALTRVTEEDIEEYRAA